MLLFNRLKKATIYCIKQISIHLMLLFNEKALADIDASLEFQYI